jgi:glycosyltransferase involved in cell wall biosynthesis
MKIVFLSNTMGRGGAEMQIKDYALRLVQRGHKVLVLSMLPFEDFEDELRAGGVETATLGMVKGKASAGALRRLLAILVRFGPDVVHAHMFAAIFASRVARLMLEPLRLGGFKPPVIIGTSHAPFERASRRYVAYRLTDRFSDLWTNVCQEGIERHERERAVPHGSGVLTMNGIDVARFRPDAPARAAKRAELGIESDTFLWLTVGSFRDDQKDYPNLLRAAARLDRAIPWRIAIAGGGVLLDEMTKLAETLGVGDRVMFLGLRPDVLGLMQAADAFVLASWFEAMPIVLLEAAACALPCVVTDVGQNGAILGEGTGIVVPSKDDTALASAMARLVAMTASERRTMGRLIRERVTTEFSIDAIVRAWEDRYKSVLARAGAAALPTGRHESRPVG